MSEIIVGKLLTGNEKKDAIHFALMPMVSQIDFAPGAHCNAHGNNTPPFVGIVDPFLKQGPCRGDKFWLFLYPNTVTGMRHEWQHPAFPETKGESAIANDPENESRRFIENAATAMGLTFDRVMSDASDWLEYGDYKVEMGSEQWRDNFPNATQFWQHYEKIKNITVPEDKRASFYSCSC